MLQRGQGKLIGPNDLLQDSYFTYILQLRFDAQPLRFVTMSLVSSFVWDTMYRMKTSKNADEIYAHA